MRRYNPKEIEPKWQKKWDQDGTYVADLDSDKPKYIAMSMFNYPSGAGIHIGHAMNYTISDVLARFKRQQGYESYHPVGWDSFGLPAENYAIKAGVSPQASMATIIPNYHKQYKAMGWSNDWTKEIATHTPEYYKWSQWIFSEMYRAGLAYQDARMQWWCEKCQTVLANEQVIDDKCWRHDGPDDPIVEKKEVKQWFFKITEYADELLEAIEDLNWTESVKLAQKNWIGKSVGAEVKFKIEGHKEDLTVFTTRPDTLFGATFMVLAPEHELVEQITTKENQDKVEEYVKESTKKTEIERQANKEKTGVFTGAYAINPVNDEKIPIWIADYVLMGYGTGAIMAVPAHDERDFEFAKKFNLPINQVVKEASDYDNISTEAILENLEEIAGLSKEKDFKYAVVGGVAKNLQLEKPTSEWKNSDLDIFVDKKGNEVIKSFYESKGYKTKTSSDFDWTNYHSLNDGSHWIDLFESQDDLFKNLKTKIVNNLELSVPDKNALAKISQELSRGVINIFSGEGLMVNSDKYNGIESSEAREKIVADLAEKGLATEKVNYKMRDWSVSRQRYWGAPIPIINCEKCGSVLLEDSDLPVVLPELEDFQPSGDGRSALARATEWLKVDCPKCGGKAERETDTLDTYICSSWYMLRYFDPENAEQAFDSKRANKWMPIDFYNGADHATAHLLYARFVTRFFHKKGLVDNPEPFKKFLFNGKVTAKDGKNFSKTLGNGPDPLEIINQGYGADAVRTYLMFAAPLELGSRWDPQGVPGAHRFLSRLWNLTQEYLEAKNSDLDAKIDEQLKRATNQMIYKVTKDIENNRYNTAISAAMACLNELYKLKVGHLKSNDAWKDALQSLIACVAPFAPHISEELWHQLGNTNSIHVDHWPQWDDKYLVNDTLTIAIQVNGKVRGEIEVSADSSEEEILEAASKNEKVATYLEGNEIKKQFYVKGRLVSFVV